MEKNVIMDYKVGDLIYDPGIYDGMNTDLSDLEFYARWLPKSKDVRILELCCGSGRLTVPIAELGYYITGIDFTSSMINRAREKAISAGVSITFLEADIRALDLPHKYDLIFIPFNSIHHLYTNEDLFKVFKNVRHYLEQGGLFIMDCFNPDIQYLVKNEGVQREIARYTTEDGRKILIKQSMKYESQTQINRIEWHYYINGGFDSSQKLDMRLFFPQELDTYLKINSFDIIHKFGDFQERAFDSASKKQIYICR